MPDVVLLISMMKSAALALLVVALSSDADKLRELLALASAGPLRRLKAEEEKPGNGPVAGSIGTPPVPMSPSRDSKSN